VARISQRRIRGRVGCLDQVKLILEITPDVAVPYPGYLLHTYLGSAKARDGFVRDSHFVLVDL